MCIAFVPAGVSLLLLIRLAASVGLAILVWPALLLFAAGCVLLMQSVDTCPWCGKSFHASWRPGAEYQGFSSLFRKTCANCGEPGAESCD